MAKLGRCATKKTGLAITSRRMKIPKLCKASYPSVPTVSTVLFVFESTENSNQSTVQLCPQSCQFLLLFLDVHSLLYALLLIIKDDEVTPTDIEAIQVVDSVLGIEAVLIDDKSRPRGAPHALAGKTLSLKKASGF